jgi:hypothetical protein
MLPPLVRFRSGFRTPHPVKRGDPRHGYPPWYSSSGKPRNRECTRVSRAGLLYAMHLPVSRDLDDARGVRQTPGQSRQSLCEAVLLDDSLLVLPAKVDVWHSCLKDSRVRGNDGHKQPVSCSATRGGSGVELQTEIYGAANSAVNVIVSPARPSWEPTGTTLTSLASEGPPPVTVRVYTPGRTMTS